MYCIAGKFGEDFCLAVWQIIKVHESKFLPILEHNVIHNTHTHIYAHAVRDSIWCAVHAVHVGKRHSTSASRMKLHFPILYIHVPVGIPLYMALYTVAKLKVWPNIKVILFFAHSLNTMLTKLSRYVVT